MLICILTKKDRKSGSAGMPRPSSYAVFCLKKKITTLAVLLYTLVCSPLPAPSFSHSVIVFSSLMFPPPPRSTLFPYTTLFRSCHLKNIWTAPLPPETELSRQMTTSTTSIDIMGLQAAYANLHTDQERDYFMQRYHDVISSFGGKTSYDADNR